MFPNFGSHYDPAITALVETIVAVIVALSWRPMTRTPRLDVSADASATVGVNG
jgi:hypothetical protein